MSLLGVTCVRQSEDPCSLCFAYVMDELTVFEARRFVRHMKECPVCQKEYEELKDLRYHAELDLQSKRDDGLAFPLHPFSLQFYWLAASAMVLVLALSFALPRHEMLIGRFRESASAVHSTIREQFSDIDMAAHRLLVYRFPPRL